MRAGYHAKSEAKDQRALILSLDDVPFSQVKGRRILAEARKIGATTNRKIQGIKIEVFYIVKKGKMYAFTEASILLLLNEDRKDRAETERRSRKKSSRRRGVAT